MKEYYDQHIGIYENAVSNEMCNEIIEYFHRNHKKISPRGEIETHTFQIKDSSLFLEDKNLQSKFKNVINQIIKLYCFKYPSLKYGFYPLALEDYKIQKTLPTEGYHPFHIEQNGESLYYLKRIAAYTLYLNDVEEGGETEFLYQLKRVKPKKGTICIFPAGYTHAHRGNTPFSGEKYIMTGWIITKKL